MFGTKRIHGCTDCLVILFAFHTYTQDRGNDGTAIHRASAMLLATIDDQQVQIRIVVVPGREINLVRQIVHQVIIPVVPIEGQSLEGTQRFVITDHKFSEIKVEIFKEIRSILS